MVKKMKPHVRAIYEYVKAHEDENITASDIQIALGIEDVRKVNGVITMSFCRHKDENKEIVPLMERVPGEATTNEKGKAIVPKYIKLTDEGRNIEIEDVE